MKILSSLFRSRGLPACSGVLVFSVACLIGLHAPSVGAAIDTAATQGVWKAKYGVTTGQMADTNWLNADADGDGMTNGEEIASGTNPFSAGSVVQVTEITTDATNVSLTFPSVTGKRYVLQGSQTLSGFASLGVTGMGTGNSMVLTGAKGLNQFFRVLVEDVDSDGDGLCDWVEAVTGLNPNSPTVEEGNEEHAFVTAQIALPHEVNIQATETFASEDGPTSGKFTVTRTQKLLPITVNLNTTGTAGAGVDYSPSLPASVSFPAGTDSVEITVNPQVNGGVEGSESVTASLVASTDPQPPFVLGAQSSATVIIGDSTTATGTGLLARYYDHASNIYAHGANFGDFANYAFTRGTPTTTGTILVTPTTGNLATILAALSVGTQVRLTFNGGNLNNALYNHLDYSVTAKTASNFTVSITAAAALPTNSSSNCYFSIQPVHPAVIERVDPTVNSEWMGGTANGNFITPANSPDNYSSAWEGYLSPTTAGNYTFQLDADDKARVLLDTGSGLVQILEHGWDGPATVGAFKQSTPIALAVPATPAARYKIRVEHVETTGEARCRLQWKLNSGGFANIPQANVFTHTTAMTSNYNYTRTDSTLGAMLGNIIVTLSGGHTFDTVTNNQAQLYFSSGNLFTPANGNFHGTYTVTAVTATTFTVSISGANLPASGTGAGFVANQPNSTTTGWFNQIYANTAFTAPPGRVGVDNAGATNSNNGLYGIGSPDTSLMAIDTFSIRWSGQVQPQFTEEYTFVVHADDGCTLRINGQVQQMKFATTTSSGGTYSYTSATGNMVVTHPSIPAGSFIVGETVRVDPTGGSITALAFADYVVTAVAGNTFTVNVGTALGADATNQSCNIEGLNKPLNDWASMGNERYVRIPMVGGVRYDIQLDYYENGGFSRCILYWYSPSQSKQVIPAERLYPASVTQAPAAHTGTTTASALVGGPFSYTVGGSNGGTVNATGLPAGLNLVGGVISGTPTAAGDYQIVITITNGAGTSTSVLNLHVEDAGGTVPREYWNGVAGTTVASIPVGNPPTGTTNLTLLEGPTDFGDNYGARIRGYINAPETGNYYFWLAASNAAELWISNDAEPVNIFKRAWVTTGNATPQTWTGEANQKSPWLALEQGKKYYFEILHKAGVGSGDNVAVGWSKPGQPTTAPSEVVPGYALSPYIAPTAGSTPGTLYVATMLAQGGAVTNGVGSSTLRVNEDETIAYLKFSFGGLTGPLTAKHIHADPYLSHPAGEIIYDIDTPDTPGDGLITNPADPNYGAYKWTIAARGTYSAAEIREIIKQGKTYINLHTVMYGNGEIRGNFTLANGTRTFTPPPAPLTWTDDSNTDAGAVRFLTQASFGANIVDITALKALSATGADPAAGRPASRYNTWIDNQFALSATPHLPEVLAREIADVFGPFDVRVAFNTWWKTSMTAPDQLRQRVAFALSEIHVVSGQGPLEDNSRGLADFYDTLAANAFGNFRDTLIDTTLTPAMGRYLDMLRNDKPDLTVGRIPNENYAREIKQLFSIGLYRMWPDGTLMLTSQDTPIDTYTQREIVGLSHVFTGWDYGYDGAHRTSIGATADWTRPMREVPARHFTGPKRVLNNEVLPGLATVGGQPLDPYATHNSTHFSDTAYQNLPAEENEIVHDMLFNHPNTGPFICRQLIQRMVTSHPSRDYLYRVVQKFNDNGSGVRGDMKAVIKAILLDYEARNSTEVTKPSFGKQREPIMRVAQAARAFRPSGVSGTYAQTGTNVITITTSTPHLLATNNVVFLEFTDATTPTAQPVPTTGSYTVTGVPSATTYTVNAPGWLTGTYSQTAGSTTMTVTMSGHWLPGPNASQPTLPAANRGQAYFDFTSGTANGLAGFDQTVRTVTSSSSFDTPSGVGNTNSVGGTFNGSPTVNNTFTITAPDTTARSGNLMVSRFPSSYSCTGAGGTITIDTTYGGAGTYGTMADHALPVGTQVFLNFMNSRDTTSFNETSTANDVVYTINGVPDANTFTVQALSAPNAAMNSDNQVTVFPLVAQPLVRNGTVNTRQGTYNLDNTDTDLSQTPLNSPTVFNYFLPDYKFAGTLASQGLTTPEFQLTAETTAIRQSNFLYNGLFNPGNTNGISSFKTGSHALVLDLTPWMGAAASNLGLGAPANTGVPWTHNQNLTTLISQLNTLLLAGQLPATSATVIKNFIATPISSIATGSPCVITTSVAHKLNVGDTVLLTGVTGGTFSPAGALGNSTTARTVASVPSSTTFTLTSVNCTALPTSVTNAHVSVVQYNQGVTNPGDTNKRDRLRSIIHLILTSPDYTIQR